MPKTRKKLVLIEWEDSVLGFQGWKVVKDNINTLTKFISVGFLMYKDKEKTILFPHIEDSSVDDVAGSGDITIPNSAIRKIKVLKV